MWSRNLGTEQRAVYDEEDGRCAVCAKLWWVLLVLLNTCSVTFP